MPSPREEQEDGSGGAGEEEPAQIAEIRAESRRGRSRGGMRRNRSRVLLTNLLTYGGLSRRSRQNLAEGETHFGRGVMIHQPGCRPLTEDSGEADESGGVCGKRGPRPHYCSNAISTTKYSALTFFPKALYEQFRRVANLYFLFGAILSLTPLSPYQAASLIAPLVLVVGLPMTKEAVEDWRRRQAVRSTLQFSLQAPRCTTVYCADGSWDDTRVDKALQQRGV